MCACEEKPRRRIRDLVVSLIRYHFLAIDLSLCLSASPVLDLQHPAESYTHIMSYLDSAGYRHFTFTEPILRNDQHDSLGHLNDKSCLQALSLTSEVSELPASLLSLALALPLINTTALSDLQSDHHVPGAKETQDGIPAEAEKCSIPGPPLTNFHAFGNLPPELRIKIWRLSFLPRVVELHHTSSNHVATARDDGSQEQQQQWQSGCNNPAALSVCAEAREIALEHFRIAYPLASPVSSTIFNGKARLRRRVLYISPEYDTVALLGLTDSVKLSTLLDSFCDADRKGKGVSILALSTSGQGNDESVTTNFDTTILRDLEQLILFTYDESLPPYEWSARGAGINEQSLDSFRKTGNKCELVPCKSNAWYVYKQWMRGKGRQFWDNQRRILQVGKNRIRIQDLEFSNGW